MAMYGMSGPLSAAVTVFFFLAVIIHFSICFHMFAISFVLMKKYSEHCLTNQGDDNIPPFSEAQQLFA